MIFALGSCREGTEQYTVRRHLEDAQSSSSQPLSVCSHNAAFFALRNDFPPASDAARSYLPHRYPEVVGPNHEANDALPPQELREREGEQPSAKPEKRSQASFINIEFCHDRPPFQIPDALDYTSLRMPNANIVTRLGQTFAKRSLLLAEKC